MGDDMRIGMKCIFVFFIGLLAGCIGYPILHEGAHILAAVCCRVPIEQVRFSFIGAHILCDVQDASAAVQICVALSGTLVPALLFLHRQKTAGFLFWYFNWALRGVCAAVCLFSAGMIFGDRFGRLVPQEDTAFVLRLRPSLWWLGGIYFVLSAFLFLQMYRDMPIIRLQKYFFSTNDMLKAYDKSGK